MAAVVLYANSDGREPFQNDNVDLHLDAEFVEGTSFIQIVAVESSISVDVHAKLEGALGIMNIVGLVISDPACSLIIPWSAQRNPVNMRSAPHSR